MSTPRGEPVRGNAGDAVAAALAKFGVAARAVSESVEDAFTQVAAELGVEAQYVGMRYGQLEVRAEPNHATLLRYDKDTVLSKVSELSGVRVSGLRIYTR